MAKHETFTNDQALAGLLGPMVRGGSPIQGEPTWSGSVSVWSGTVLPNTVPTTTASTVVIVRFPLSGLPGITGIDAEVSGTPVFNASGQWFGMNITKIEWSPIGSATLLARWTFDAPTFFGMDTVLYTGTGSHQFIDPFSFGANQLNYWDTLFNGADSLVGAGANDSLRGGNSNDTFDGGQGSDTLVGDAGDDTFIYRKGDATAQEQLFGGDGIDRILSIGTAATANLLQAGAVNLSSLNYSSIEAVWTNGTEVILNSSQLVGGAAFNQFVGKNGAIDVVTVQNAGGWNFSTLIFSVWESQDLIGLLGSAASEDISGTNYSDVIFGGLGMDSLYGAGGNDRFLIEEGDTAPLDIISGDAGTDVLQVKAGASVANLRGLTLSSVETLDLVSGIATVDASDLNGSFAPNATSATTDRIGKIIGSGIPANVAGTLVVYIDNNLEGLTLRDTVFESWDDGAAVNDLRIVAGSQTGLIFGAINERNEIIGQFAQQGIFMGGGANGDIIRGSSFGDYILGEVDTVTGGGFIGGTLSLSGDFIEGLDGNDTIESSGGADTIYGGAGSDFISSQGGSDILYGEDGNDILSGGSGGDALNGGTGWDTANYANSTASVQVVMYNLSYNTGDAAGDTFVGIEAIQGSGYADILVGDFNANAIIGGGGGDWIDGTGGGDYLYGLTGSDSLISRQQADVLDGGADFDYVRYDYADAGLRAYLYDTAQNSGWAAGDTFSSIEGLAGSHSADDLRGDANQNIIYGLGGADFIIGLGGSDLLIGGAGQDLFHFVGIGDGGAGGDVIQDFVSGQDRISVTGAFFGLGSPGPGGAPIDSWRFVSGTAATVASSQFIYNAATRQLFYDQDGTGAGTQVLLATLQAGATMAAGDVLVL
jgi:Ca2+-binding RTX toxin-like protein